MRKARDEDAQRVAQRDGDIPPPGEALESADSSSRLTARGAITQRFERGGTAETTVSGRRVIIEHEGAGSRRYSTRLVGPQATSVKLAAGDTIIKYRSGDMVIRRGARRAQLRRQIIWCYALGYLLLFGLYMFFLVTGKTTITPEGFVEKAFSLRHGTGIVDLERAAYEAMRGNRTPAEIHMAQRIAFYDDDKDNIVVEKGDRLTLLTAAKLGKAIIDDMQKPEAQRTFRDPFKIYKENYLAGVNWPFYMTLYNAIGFFLLMGLFLWRPIVHYLGTQGKKTAVAVANSRVAQDEAALYRHKYRDLAHEIEKRGAHDRAEIATRAEKRHEEAINNAQDQAQEIIGGIDEALENTRNKRAENIRGEVAVAACEQARGILRDRLGPPEHDVAIDTLIADIAGMNLRTES